MAAAVAEKSPAKSNTPKKSPAAVPESTTQAKTPAAAKSSAPPPPPATKPVTPTKTSPKSRTPAEPSKPAKSTAPTKSPSAGKSPKKPAGSKSKSPAKEQPKEPKKGEKQKKDQTKQAVKDEKRGKDKPKDPLKDGKGKSKDEKVELLKVDEVLRGRYQIEGKIGRGGCGQIYRAYDKLKAKPVAVKVATPGTDPRRMKIEQMVLTLLRGKSHFPTLISMGQIRGLPYLVMELVGRNLSEIRKRQPRKRLQPITVYRVSMQVISALHYMHNAGFLHRDIKPSNFCIGRGMYRRSVYLLDHGMARMFTEIDGTVRTARDYAGFRGTLRYVSLTVHSRRETGPCDDLIGWLYSMIELINGKLPWSHLTAATDIEQAKRKATLEDLCKDQPSTTLEFAKYITSLKYNTMPDYDKMYNLFKTVALANNCKEDTAYEWEKIRTGITEKLTQEATSSCSSQALVGLTKQSPDEMACEKTQSSENP